MKIKLITAAVLSIIFITVLTVYLYIALEREIISEKNKTEIFLHSSVSLILNSIQDDIFYIFNTLTDKRDLIDISQLKNDYEILQYFTLDRYFLDKFQGVISPGIIIDIDNNSSELLIYNLENVDEDYKEYIELLQSNKDQDMIYIKDFHGVMFFPIFNNAKRSKIIIYNLDLDTVIKDHLHGLIQKALLHKYKNTGSKNDFNIKIQKGYNLLKNKNWESSDLVIDLNRFFSLLKIDDYYQARLRRGNLYKKEHYMMDNHSYLFISHKKGNLVEYFKVKKIYYFIGLIIFYFILISAILFLLHTTYRVYLNTQREKEFTSLISHELKTPLSIIQLGSENISSGLIIKKEDVMYYGNMIKRETYKLKRMINNILVISTTKNSKQYKEFKQLKLETIINQIVLLSEGLLRQNDVRLRVDNLSKKTKIYCNEVTFIAAIFNVVKNSIRYGASFSDNKEVILKFRDKRRGVSIQVEDFGPGINRGDYKNIFKPFYRGSRNKELHLEGSGLGLSYAKKIFSDHCGYIELKNKEIGVVFEIWIPIKE